MDPSRLSLRYAALSDVGRVRKDNQDSGYASSHLLVVADGVGGAARGDVASSTAVQILRRLDAPAPEDPLEALAGALHRTHDRIAELVEADPELESTSTTVTAALFDGNRIGVAHVGDSRGYLLRDGALSQLTKDHTFVQGLIDEGRITEEESRTHPHRNLILRAVDGVHETDPDLFYIELAAGDRILLCSDGCSGALAADRLTDILGSGSIDYAVVELIRSALEAGSSDNVTCVVADVVPGDTPEDGETSAAVSTGPMLVGAAAEEPRRPGSSARGFFRGHRSGDTGELDPVPADDDDVDPEELRYAPQQPKRFTWLRRAAIMMALIAVIGLVALLAYRWTQSQYYVAVSGDKVAIYKGVPADIPGLTMRRVAESTGVTMASLPDYRAEQVRAGIDADDLTDARAIVERLTGFAAVCPSATPTPTKTPDPSQSPTGSPSGSPSGNGTQGPSGGGTAGAGESPSGNGSKRPNAGPSNEPSPTIQPPDCIEATS